MKNHIYICDNCEKPMGDFGWLDVTLKRVGPYGECFEDNHQFCNKKCLSQWSGKSSWEG